MKSVNVKVSGNNKITARLERFAKAAQKIKGYDVGFYGSSTYPDGTSVPAVAIANEFGTKSKSGKTHIPERPFFRLADKKVSPKLTSMIRGLLNQQDAYILTQKDVKRLGLLHESAIKKEIVDLREPVNAPSTLAAKAPRTNPLIDTGLMRISTTFKIIE